MKIEVIDRTSPHLPQVKALGRANAATLGFLPEGAFDDYAAKRNILGAISSSGRCIGYVLYRVSRGAAVVAHLCVDPTYRRSGVSRALVSELKKATKDLKGITLKCRRDYSASEVWPRLGFVPVSEQPGRGKKPEELTTWWFSHGHPDLFTETESEKLKSKLCVVIDTNVLFDLKDSSREGHIESTSLMADWLPSNLELCVTDEILTDINRSKDLQERVLARAHVKSLTRLQCNKESVDQISNSLRNFFPANMTPQDESDLGQLSRTIAAGIQFFITRDRFLLDQAETFYEQFGVSVLRPSDFIIRLDELNREAEYQPARLAGTLSELKPVQSGQEEILTRYFLASSQGESKHWFLTKLRRLLANPTTYRCFIALDKEQNPLALIAYGRSESGSLEIPLLRVAKGPLAATITRHLTSRSILLSARENRLFTRLTDLYPSELLKAALYEDAFFLSKDHWVKVNLPVAKSANSLSVDLSDLDYKYPEERAYFNKVAAVLREGERIEDPSVFSEIERILWPAKITDVDIPTFVVPIQPRWARDLFDEELASQILWGAKEDLAIRREYVYYSAKSSAGVMTAPGRILWYVSDDEKALGSKKVRACSQLDEVITDTPKNLYRRFRRLGIYEWKNVIDLAGGDLNRKILALRFSNTELFTSPIPFETFRDTLLRHGCRSPLISFFRVSSQVFSELYTVGTQT
jgi:GNAT superfamily N-acetyltransferase/predicted nucleic acid-binding protein